jgi:hypothetical protein
MKKFSKVGGGELDRYQLAIKQVLQAFDYGAPGERPRWREQ